MSVGVPRPNGFPRSSQNNDQPLIVLQERSTNTGIAAHEQQRPPS